MMEKKNLLMVNTPFNYTGSKFKLLDQLIPNFDYTKKYFVDLFCGGGSVYTNVVNNYEKVLVNDIIKELIDIHKELVNEPQSIISKTKSVLVNKDDADGFMELRKSFNSDKSGNKLWALMLSCTNNMMRFNKSFEFNQTFGKRSWNDSTEKKVNEFVEHISKFKDKLYFISKDFVEIKPTNPSMIYIDPPYTNTEAGYNAYWSKTKESQLYDYIIEMNNMGHSFMLSGVLGEHKNNEKSEIIYKLLELGFKSKILDYDYDKVARKKNSKNSQEIIIYNY
jgi:DNA adenine methylase Dam